MLPAVVIKEMPKTVKNINIAIPFELYPAIFTAICAIIPAKIDPINIVIRFFTNFNSFLIISF